MRFRPQGADARPARKAHKARLRQIGMQVNQGEKRMKKELIDAAVAGVALWAAHALYGFALTTTGVNDITVVGYAAIGYLTVRIAERLGRK